MVGLIYCAFDTSNGKAYVGQTGSSLDERRKQHLGSKAKLPFIHALRKRSHSFVWSVLTSGLTSQKELDDAEIYWGTYFNCLVPSGYNLRLGNGHVVWSEEEKLKNRRLQKAASARPEVKQRRSIAQRISKSSPVVREKIRQTLLKKQYKPSERGRAIMSEAATKNLSNKQRDEKGRWVKR